MNPQHRSPAVWALVFSALAVAAPAQPVPDTPAGRRFADLMAITDTGDAVRLEEYVKTNFTAGMQRVAPGDPGIVAFLAEHHGSFGGFEVVRALATGDDQVTMLVRPRSAQNRWIRYVVKVEAAPPHLVEGLFLMPANPGDIPTGTDALTAEAAVAAFAKEVDAAIAKGEFSGVVLLARGPRVALERAAGEADREHGVPVTRDTVFGLASMNKMFTGVVIGRLVEQGRLAWTDPVGKHLKGWLPDPLASSITIEPLLTHTSGLGDYLGKIETDPKLRTARSLSAFKDLVRASAVEGKPEDGLRYSNTGYVVLGAVIEAVTGRDYFDVVREEVYAKAGMTRSDSWCRDEIVPGRALGYIPPAEAESRGLGRGWRTNGNLQGTRGTSAGGGYATAGDLLRFARALVDGKLVKKETLETLLTPRVRFLSGHYGYGFELSEGRDGQRVFGHAGGFPGVNGELRIYGDGAWTLVMLSNVSGGTGGIVGAWDGIVARIGP